MATDEEKSKLAKLLQGLDVPEVKLSERCNELIKEFHEKYENAMVDEDLDFEKYENPYVPDKRLLEENEKKLKDLLAERKRLAELKNLRVLALEYAYIADGSGNALLSLLPVLRRPHFRLQLICREDQIPGRVDAALGVGGYEIPDTAWRRVAIICPDIYLFVALFRIRDYDNVQRFLTPSMPLREVHLQLGIDLKTTQRQDSDIGCFMRMLAYRYASILVTLSIHQWRSSELPLRRVIEIMPHLTRLMYTGRICASDLHDAIKIVACGVCDIIWHDGFAAELKEFKIQIQDDENKETYWQEIVRSYTEEFKDIMQLYSVEFTLKLYKI